MSYGMAAALQKAVYELLVTDPGLAELVDGQVFDGVPGGTVPGTYVSIGPEEVRDRSDVTGQGALHRFTVSVISAEDGFATVKTVAATVTDALHGADPVLERGRLVGLWFERASARRTGQAELLRQIDLRFRARVEDD